MVLVGIIDQHLKKAVQKISTAVGTRPSHTLVHPNLYRAIFSSLFQHQVAFFLAITKNNTFIPIRFTISDTSAQRHSRQSPNQPKL